MELLEKNVTTIEKLNLKRKRFPQMHAIYFISPSTNSIENLLKDFEIDNKP